MSLLSYKTKQLHFTGFTLTCRERQELYLLDSANQLFQKTTFWLWITSQAPTQMSKPEIRVNQCDNSQSKLRHLKQNRYNPGRFQSLLRSHQWKFLNFVRNHPSQGAASYPNVTAKAKWTDRRSFGGYKSVVVIGLVSKMHCVRWETEITLCQLCWRTVSFVCP